MESFREMKTALSKDAAMYMPDFAASQDKESGRPLEIVVDACDYGWGAH